MKACLFHFSLLEVLKHTLAGPCNRDNRHKQFIAGGKSFDLLHSGSQACGIPDGETIVFFIFITTPEGHVGVHFGDIIISIQSGTENRLIILLVLALAQLALSTLDLLFFSGSGASTLARELEPPRPWLDVSAN